MTTVASATSWLAHGEKSTRPRVCGLGSSGRLPGTRRHPQERCPLSTSRPTIPARQCRAWAPRTTRLTNGFGRVFWTFTASTSPTRRDHLPSRCPTTARNQSASPTKSPTKHGAVRVAVPPKATTTHLDTTPTDLGRHRTPTAGSSANVRSPVEGTSSLFARCRFRRDSEVPSSEAWNERRPVVPTVGERRHANVVELA
jgi:hypothetical protein